MEETHPSSAAAAHAQLPAASSASASRRNSTLRSWAVLSDDDSSLSAHPSSKHCVSALQSVSIEPAQGSAITQSFRPGSSLVRGSSVSHAVHRRAAPSGAHRKQRPSSKHSSARSFNPIHISVWSSPERRWASRNRSWSDSECTVARVRPISMHRSFAVSQSAFSFRAEIAVLARVHILAHEGRPVVTVLGIPPVVCCRCEKGTGRKSRHESRQPHERCRAADA